MTPPRSAAMPAASSSAAPAPISLRRCRRPPPCPPPRAEEGRERAVRLLVTRPEPDGERTAAVLRARGHDVVLAALLQVEAIADAQLGSGPWSALIVTSANALRAIEA